MKKNDFNEKIKKQEYKMFFGLIMAILFIPVMSFLLLRNLFENQATPAFITLGIIIFLKFSFIIYILVNQQHLTDERKKKE